MHRVLWLEIVGMLALVGCGAPVNPPDPKNGSSRCEATTEYLAFDPANHAPQDLRLQKLEEMLALFADAEKAPATSTDKATLLLALYEEPGAALSVKVAGRKDVHFTDDRANVGPGLDAAIRGAITELKAATTAQQVRIAKQKFEKAGFNRFLYLSIVQELYEPSFKHYDEAYGYLGTGPTNAEAGRKSFARIATKRDGNNGTTLAAELFADIVEGGCLLQRALEARGATEMKTDDDPAYAQLVQRLDHRLQLVAAYSVGHELIELDAKRTDLDLATVKLYEGDGYFRIIEPHLLAAGSARAQLAAELRAALDAALAKSRANDPSWVNELRALHFVERLEAIFTVDVKA